jgi:transcriptional regulator with XRE-family HTH domain
MFTIRSMADVGAVARGARVARGLSQTELARRAGVPRGWVARLESGRANPTLGPLLRLLEELDVTLQVTAPVTAAGAEGGDDPPITEIDLDRLLEGYGA